MLLFSFAVFFLKLTLQKVLCKTTTRVSNGLDSDQEKKTPLTKKA